MNVCLGEKQFISEIAVRSYVGRWPCRGLKPVAIFGRDRFCHTRFVRNSIQLLCTESNDTYFVESRAWVSSRWMLINIRMTSIALKSVNMLYSLATGWVTSSRHRASSWRLNHCTPYYYAHTDGAGNKSPLYARCHCAAKLLRSPNRLLGALLYCSLRRRCGFLRTITTITIYEHTWFKCSNYT